MFLNCSSMVGSQIFKTNYLCYRLNGSESVFRTQFFYQDRNSTSKCSIKETTKKETLL